MEDSRWFGQVGRRSVELQEMVWKHATKLSVSDSIQEK